MQTSGKLFSSPEHLLELLKLPAGTSFAARRGLFLGGMAVRLAVYDSNRQIESFLVTEY